jgi:hypothetical protein
MPVNEINGTDAANTLIGTGADDLIYGFNPDGPQAGTSAISATRVAVASAPVFVGAPEGDAERLFIVEKGGLIRISISKPD